MQQLPSHDPYDPGYRRLRYVRYADDFVLGFIGPKVEAQQVKESLETFLRDSLKLELSREKTLISHATSQAARFLGYELVNQQANDQFDRNGRRRVNGQIGLRVPANVIEQHCQAYMRKGKPAHRSYLLHDEDFGSWHSTSRSSGASSTTTFWPPTSPISGDCNRSWRCLWHGPLRQSTSPPHGRCDASTRASWKPSTGRASVSRSQAQGQRQATSRGIFRWHRWHTPETATAGSPSRPTASTVQERPQRAYQTARSGRVRGVPPISGRRSSPHPRPSRPERERPTGKAQVGTNHGGAKTQDSRGLPDMSHGHPPRAQVIRNRSGS